MKKYIVHLSAICLLFVILTSAGTSKEELYKEHEGLRITYTRQNQQADNQHVMEYLILKIENKNAYAVKCTWKLDLWYNGNCRTCNQTSPSGYEFELELQPGQVVKGDIKKEDLMLKIFSKSIKPKTEGGLTRFEFTDLTLSKN